MGNLEYIPCVSRYEDTLPPEACQAVGGDGQGHSTEVQVQALCCRRRPGTHDTLWRREPRYRRCPKGFEGSRRNHVPPSIHAAGTSPQTWMVNWGDRCKPV